MKPKKPSPPKLVTPYRGRFAPSPTGPLHFGSLVSALSSYLDAKAQQGTWLLRIEDIDTPRCSQQASDAILFTLEAYGLHWDESVIYQSQRLDLYQQVLQQLQKQHVVYPCSCSRKTISSIAQLGIDGPIYPGTCRHSPQQTREHYAWRVLTNDQPISFHDQLQGPQQQQLASQLGDFVVKRADGLFAYQLAVVVDDQAQQINHIVRGIDLLASTPRQIYLQQQLLYPQPHYTHLPIAVNPAGEKLSKQTCAPAITTEQISTTLWQALRFLQQDPPADLRNDTPANILGWAIQHWQIRQLQGITQAPVPEA